MQFTIHHSQFTSFLLKFAFALFLLTPLAICAPVDLDTSIPGSIGMDIHFVDPRPGEMEMLAAAGVRWVRIDFAWENTEVAPGQYDFSAYDRMVTTLASYKISPYFILDYANKLYDNGLSPYTEEGRRAFANWASAAVEHFKGRGIIWELYNEPNFRFWRPKPNAHDYVLLALEVGEAIRAVAPKEAYVGPATSLIDFSFLAACFKAGTAELLVRGFRAPLPATRSGERGGRVPHPAEGHRRVLPARETRSYHRRGMGLFIDLELEGYG